MPSDFTFDGGANVATKSNLVDLPVGADASKYLSAADCNIWSGALSSLRDAILNGRWHALQDYPTASVSASGGVAFRANAGVLEISQDGGSYETLASLVGSDALTVLTGDVTTAGEGSQAATVVTVGGSTASLVHSAELLSNAATNTNTASAIVKRDASGNFNAGSITGTFLDARGQLTADGANFNVTASVFDTVTAYGSTPNTGISFGGKRNGSGDASGMAGVGFLKANTTSDDAGGILRFFTRPTGDHLTTSQTERGRIGSAGRWLIGTTSDDGSTTFQVSGTATVSGALTLGTPLAITSGGTGKATALAFTDITGTASAGQLPNPGASSLGGVQSKAAVTSNFLTAISTSGVVSAAQPAPSDLTGWPANSSGVLTNDGSGNFSWAAAAGSGVTTMAAVGSSPNANGASISSVTLTLQPASASFPGVLSAAHYALLANATASLTGSTLVLRDSNGNAQFTNAVEGYTTTATAAATTTLTVASTYEQRFTGSTTQNVVLPDATTLATGVSYFIVNKSSGTVTVKDGGSSTLVAVLGGQSVLVTCTSIGSTAGGWDFSGMMTMSSTGNMSVAGTLSASNLSSTNSGDVTLGAVGSSPNGNGASLSTQVLTLQPADGSNPGVLSAAHYTLLNGATSAATASTLLKRDSSSNARLNALIPGFTTTATAAGTTTLAVTDTYTQVFTGSTTQTVVLPDATTLVVGQQFRIVNRSSGTVTVNKNGGSLVLAVTASSEAIFTATAIGTSAGSWDAGLPVAGGGVTTLAAVGSSPNGNAGTISGSTLTLQPADASNPGVLSAAHYSLLNGATAAATASTLMKRDASVNFRANSYIPGYTTTATAAGTTTLAVTDTYEQRFSGSTTQTVKLPDATTLVVGQRFFIVNKSTGTVTINDNGSTLVTKALTGQSILLVCTNIGSAAGAWDFAGLSTIDSGGRTLIGTNTSDGSSALQVSGTTALLGYAGVTAKVSGDIVTDTDIKYHAAITNDVTAFGSSPSAGLSFGARYNSSNALTPIGGIAAVKENTTDGNVAGYVALYTRNNTSNTTKEGLRLTSTRHVLINTTTDDGTNFLQVAGAALTGYLTVSTTAPATDASIVACMTVINDSTAYNANPVAGIEFVTKYKSDGSEAGLGGITVGKENATTNNLASYLALHTRVAGGNNTEAFRINSTQDCMLSTEGNKLGLNGTGLTSYIKGNTSSHGILIQSNVTNSGTNASIVLNAGNAITGTTLCLDVQNNAVSKFSVGQAGDTTAVGIATSAGATNTGARIESKRTTVADADKSVATSDHTIAYTSIAAARAVTLPTATLGLEIVVLDESGSCSLVNTITIATVQGGSVVLNTAYGYARFWANGSNWYRVG